MSNPWDADTWNETAQANYIREHGRARAEARAADAGTTLHGGRPKKHIILARPGPPGPRGRQGDTGPAGPAGSGGGGSLGLILALT